MSIATEITRLQGIKTDIRTALVTQGIAQASSHNMADFSADILAIQGSGGEGVYITVTCDSAYIGYDIILSANESELDRKQCPSSKEVNFFVSADDITLPAIFTISNSLNSITSSVTANVYGWYETDLINELVVPLISDNWELTSATTNNYTLNYTNDGIEFSGRGTSGKESFFVLCTKKPINFSDYTKLVVNSDWVKSCTQNDFNIGLSDDRTNYQNPQSVNISRGNNTASVVDVSSPKYVKICLNCSGGSNYYINLKFTDIHFEK